VTMQKSEAGSKWELDKYKRF